MRATAFFLAIAVALGVACGDSTGPEDVAGTYALQTVNGSGPPWFTTLSNALGSLDGEMVVYEMRLEWISGSLQLNRDATFSETFVVRETVLAISITTGDIVLDSTTTYPQTQSGTFTVAKRDDPVDGLRWHGAQRIAFGQSAYNDRGWRCVGVRTMSGLVPGVCPGVASFLPAPPRRAVPLGEHRYRPHTSSA